MKKIKRKCKNLLLLFLASVIVMQELPMTVYADGSVDWDVHEENATVGIEFDMLAGIAITTKDDSKAVVEISKVISTDENYIWNSVDTTFIPEKAGQYSITYYAVALADNTNLGEFTRTVQVNSAENEGNEEVVEAIEGEEIAEATEHEETIRPNEDEMVARENDSEAGKQNEDILESARENPIRRAGSDRSSDFQIDRSAIKVAGKLVYTYDKGSETINSQVIEVTYNPKIEFDVEFSQVDATQADFVGGDHILFEICEVIAGSSNSNSIDWTQLTADKPLYDDNIQLGIGSLVPVKIDENKIKLFLKIFFTDNIDGQFNISGAVNGGASAAGLNSAGDEAIVNVDGQTVVTVDKVDPSTSVGSPGVLPGLTISTPKKTAIYHNDNANTILWRIYATEYVSNSFKDYKNGTSTTYKNLILEDMLDINQTFQRILIRAPLYLYDKENPDSSVKYRFTHASFSWNVSAGTSRLTDYSAYPDAETRVRAMPLSYAIITEPDPTSPSYSMQRLIMNLGAPGSDGILYSDMNFNMDTVVSDLWDAFDNCITVLASNPSAGSKDVLTDRNGKSGTKADWEKFKTLYYDSWEYYKRFASVTSGGAGESPYAYSYEIDLVTKVKTEQEVTNLSSTATNSFRLSGGFTTTEGSATKTNFWSGIIKAWAVPGDIQIFKADSLYGNIAGDKPNAAGVPGAMKDVQFEVYQSDGTGPLSFDFIDEKYHYNSNGGGVTVITSKTDGSLIISKLPNGKYYVKEIWAPEGYYTGQNTQVDFYINDNHIAYKLINNDPRGVSLRKVDADDHSKTLENATFELYTYTNSDYSDAEKLNGFNSKTINGTVYLVYDNSGTDTLATGSDGRLNIVQLPAGKYYLQEVIAPGGYRVSDERHTFELSADKTGDAIVDLGEIENKHSDQIKLVGAKNLIGKTLEDDMFNFAVMDENGSIVATATNKADGTIRFSSIEFHTEGTYTYMAREINDETEGITYDDTEYRIIVTVKNEGNDTLKAIITYPDGQIVFNNSYEKTSSGKSGKSDKSDNINKKESPERTADPGESDYSRLIKTGDNSMVSYWLIALGISASLMSILFWVNDKRKLIPKNRMWLILNPWKIYAIITRQEKL